MTLRMVDPGPGVREARAECDECGQQYALPLPATIEGFALWARAADLAHDCRSAAEYPGPPRISQVTIPGADPAAAVQQVLDAEWRTYPGPNPRMTPGEATRADPRDFRHGDWVPSETAEALRALARDAERILRRHFEEGDCVTATAEETDLLERLAVAGGGS